MSDAYVAVRSSGTWVHGSPETRGDIVFVDIDRGLSLDRLRTVPPDLFRRPGATLLIRSPDEDFDRAHANASKDLAATTVVDAGPPGDTALALREMLAKWPIRMRVGVLHQPVGAPAWIEAVQEDPSGELSRARAIELEALLKRGKAIWRPQHYHYRLPSGQHAEHYVKVSDAIREPRDAHVIATWLLPTVREGTGLVLDSGTMTPVALAVQNLMRCVDLGPGQVAVLDRYPTTQLDVDAAIERAADRGRNVIGLLSINSSGRVRDRMMQALEDRRVALSGDLHVLVDTTPPQPRAGLQTWHPIAGAEPLVKRGSAAEQECNLCRDPARARLIPINPSSLDGMIRPELRLIMPSVSAPRGSRRFWEAAHRLNAITIEGTPAKSVRAFRLEERMAVVADLSQMIGDREFQDLCHDRLEEVLQGTEVDGTAELVLVPEHETDFDHFRAFWGRVGPLLGSSYEPFPVEGEFSDDLKQKIREADKVAVFALGAVTGRSLQRALVGAEEARESIAYELPAVVVHARPATKREWITLCNSYASQMYAAWHTYLPDLSPMAEENRVLELIDPGHLEGAARDFYDSRSKLCAGELGEGAQPVFWGSSAGDVLTPHSIYGQRIDVTTTYAAVGAAMAQGRIDSEEKGAPELHVFELEAMFRSYYDPIIVCAFLRWLRPFEAWWGWEPTKAAQIIEGLLGRSSEADIRILVPELLLAVGQGKVPPAAAQRVVAHAEALCDGLDDDEMKAILRVGLLAAEVADGPGHPEPAMVEPPSPGA